MRSIEHSDTVWKAGISAPISFEPAPFLLSRVGENPIFYPVECEPEPAPP